MTFLRNLHCSVSPWRLIFVIEIYVYGKHAKEARAAFLHAFVLDDLREAIFDALNKLTRLLHKNMLRSEKKIARAAELV